MPYIGSDADDVFMLSALDDIVYGFGGADYISDRLGEVASDDWMFGGTGADTLESSSGADVMFGGKGADTFSFESGADNLMIRGGKGWDIAYLPRELFSASEAEYFVGANRGVLLQMLDGGVLDIEGVEQIWPI